MGAHPGRRSPGEVERTARAGKASNLAVSSIAAVGVWGVGKDRDWHFDRWRDLRVFVPDT